MLISCVVRAERGLTCFHLEWGPNMAGFTYHGGQFVGRYYAWLAISWVVMGVCMSLAIWKGLRFWFGTVCGSVYGIG